MLIYLSLFFYMAAKIQYLFKIKITIVKNSNTYKKLIETYNVFSIRQYQYTCVVFTNNKIYNVVKFSSLVSYKV